MTLQIAQEIVAHCANCKKDLAHTITAMDNGRVTSVLCGSCKEEHAFASSIKVKPAPKKRSQRKAQPKNARLAIEEWKVVMERAQDLSATLYTMGGQYSEGEKLNHNTFGMGLIQKLIPPNKMEVLFESGSKMLIRGGSHSG
jgi:hypothetical protein